MLSPSSYKEQKGIWNFAFAETMNSTQSMVEVFRWFSEKFMINIMVFPQSIDAHEIHLKTLSTNTKTNKNSEYNAEICF